MTSTIGHASLLLALALALWGIAAPILGKQTGRELFVASARLSILGQFFLVTVASLALIYALVSADFSIKYVAFNTTRATPVYYRVTGLWGALEGSLMLWEWILIIFSYQLIQCCCRHLCVSRWNIVHCSNGFCSSLFEGL